MPATRWASYDCWQFARVIAITGVTGQVGAFCAARLLADGYGLRVLLRPGQDLPAWLMGAQLEVVHAPLDYLDATTFLTGCRGLLHAAFAHAPGRYRGGEGDDPVGFWQTNFMTSLALLEAAQQQRLTRVILFSSRAVFSRKRQGLLDETAPLDPDTHYGAQKAALEALVQAYGAQGLPVTCLRPTGIYGLHPHGQSAKWWPWLDLLRENAPWPAARLATEVHGKDLGQAASLLMSAPEQDVRGRVFNISDLRVCNHDALAYLAQALDLPNRSQSCPPLQGPELDCSAIKALGWQPGGQPLWERDLQAMLAAYLSQSQGVL